MAIFPGSNEKGLRPIFNGATRVPFGASRYAFAMLSLGDSSGLKKETGWVNDLKATSYWYVYTALYAHQSFSPARKLFLKQLNGLLKGDAVNAPLNGALPGLDDALTLFCVWGIGQLLNSQRPNGVIVYVRR